MNAVVFSFFTLFVLIMATLAVLKITLLRNSRLIDSIRDLYERNSGGWIVSGILVLSIVTIVIVFQTLPSMPQSFRQFLHRNYSEGYFNGGLSVFELLAILLAVVGAVFAILARIDARNAFEASRNLQRALSSFRSSFKDIMNDIPLFVDQSRKSLSIMIPTPMYGFVFGEREAALKFKVALTNKLVLHKFLGRS